MNKEILAEEVQRFINLNLQKPGEVALKKSPFAGISSRELAEQIDSKSRSAKKLPLWFSTKGIYYPPKLSIEQASSETTAQYKSSLMHPGRIIDLTGGFGVDSYYFAQKADVWHLELNSHLSAIAEHNAQVLGAKNITFVQGDGIGYLENCPHHFDTIYVDPSRRIKMQKVFRLADCEPDVVTHLPLLLRKGMRVIIKTAPLLDIQSGLKELQHVKEIHVVSVKNDCKELLWVLESDVRDTMIVSVALNDEKQEFRFHPQDERDFKIEQFASPTQFIYEPDVALLKAGCFKLITAAYGVGKLHPNTHLYTSGDLKPNFMGRKFRLLEKWTYKDFRSTKPVTQANVICRNFPQTPEEVKKKNKLKDGGETYLLFTTGPDENLLVLHCQRL